jgi:hypothetical protein
MRILIGNCNRQELRDWHFKGLNCGTLISAGKKAILPPQELPYSLDNGAYGYFLQKKPFDNNAYREFLLKWFTLCRDNKPEWLLVPDCVGDRKKTLQMWEQWHLELKQWGVPLAIAVQDGMTKDDIPKDAEIIFVGGSTEWKLKTIPYWTAHFNRVHVGRVNGWKRIWTCYWHGVESVDGTGFFRGGINGDMSINLQVFLRFLKEKKYNELMLSSLSPSARRQLIKEETMDFEILDKLPLFQSEVINLTDLEIEVLSNWLEGIIDSCYEYDQDELKNSVQVYELVQNNQLQTSNIFINFSQLHQALTSAMDNLNDMYDEDDIDEYFYGATNKEDAFEFLEKLSIKLMI